MATFRDFVRPVLDRTPVSPSASITPKRGCFPNRPVSNPCAAVCSRSAPPSASAPSPEEARLLLHRGASPLGLAVPSPVCCHAQVGREGNAGLSNGRSPPIHAHAQVGRAVPQHIASQRPIGQFSRTVSDPGFSLPSKSRRFAASPVFPTSANLPAFSCPLQVRAKGVV